MSRCKNIIDRLSEGERLSTGRSLLALEFSLKDTKDNKKKLEDILSRKEDLDANFEKDEQDDMKERLEYYNKLIPMVDKFIKETKKLAIKYHQD